MGRGIPEEILQMPDLVLKDVMSPQFLQSPLGPLVMPGELPWRVPCGRPIAEPQTGYPPPQ